MKKELTQTELRNKLTIHRLHKALTNDGLSLEDVENLCFIMYKMGISPLTTVRKYLGKYELGNIKVIYMDGNKSTLNTLPNTDYESPVLLVFMKTSNCGEVLVVKVKYYPALDTVNTKKYSLINFTSETLKE